MSLPFGQLIPLREIKTQISFLKILHLVPSSEAKISNEVRAIESVSLKNLKVLQVTFGLWSSFQPSRSLPFGTIGFKLLPFGQLIPLREINTSISFL